jgi:hypothetical protein
MVSSMASMKLVTIKLVVQFDSLLQASFTYNVIVVVPEVISVPATGDCVITKEPVLVQLSVAIKPLIKSGTIALQLELVAIVFEDGQVVIKGAVLSRTVIVCV